MSLIISIDYNSDKKEIYLTGDLNKLKRHRFAWRYLLDYFSLNILPEKIILNVYDDNDAINILQKLNKMFHKYGIKEKKTDTSEQILIDFRDEEEKFKIFSDKALNIKNNNCDIHDFNNFKNYLIENLSNRTLYPLQLLSAYHLAFSQNGCNFSVPGAGKTSIVYGAYTYLKNLPIDSNKRVDKLLIVGPLSSFGPWENEYYECFGKKPKSKRLSGALSKEEKTKYLYSKNTYELTLISYASLAILKDEISFFLRYNKTMVVLDEAHKAKNASGGVIASAVLEIAKFCKSRVVLTGTPAPNGYEDLYNMFKFIWPTKNVIGFPVNKLRFMTIQNNTNLIDILIKNISPYFLRIKKSDLNLVPAIVHPPIYVEMGNKQKKIYNYIEKKYIDSLIDDRQKNISKSFKSVLVQAKTIRLMQAATNPAMLISPLEDFILDEFTPIEALKAINDEEVLKIIYKYPSLEIPSKYIEVKKLVEKIINRGEKVIVWASFIYTIETLKKYLENEGIKSEVLYGAIPIENEMIDDDIATRESIIKEFHSDSCPYKVIIANPFAVAESISLHKACNNAIYLERSFNAAHFVQSKDRIHRYGLPKGITTNYYYILSKDTIDETIDERLALKEERMNEIMEKMPIPLFSNVSEDLGDEDIKALIRNYVRRIKKS